MNISSDYTSSSFQDKIMHMFAHQQQLSGPPPAEQQTEHHWQTILTLILLVLLGPSSEMTGWIPLH